MLQNALFGCKVLEQIDWTGNSRDFTTRLLSRLLDFGDYTEGKPAIIAVLESLTSNLGLNKQAEIDALIAEVLGTLSPSATSNAVTSAKTSEKLVEKEEDADTKPIWQNPTVIGGVIAAIITGIFGILIAVVPPLTQNWLNISNAQATETRLAASQVALTNSTSTLSANLVTLSANPSSSLGSTASPNAPAISTVAPTATSSAAISLSILIDEASLTVFSHREQSIAGLSFAIQNNGQIQQYPLQNSFPALGFSNGIASMNSCWVYALNNSQAVLSQRCTGQTFRYDTAAADRFWYDATQNRFRDIAIYRDAAPTSVICPAGQAVCEFEW